MTEADAELLVSTLQESFPRHPLSGQERRYYRDLFQRYDSDVVNAAVRAHVEESPSPVFSDIRAQILNRASPRSDYQRQSRMERIAFEQEEREKATFFRSLSPRERELRCSVILEKHHWLREQLKGHDLSSSKMMKNLIYHDAKGSS